MDANGYIKYLCRNDDVITRAGYPVRPAPIEECPVRHPSMRFAAVIGVKDDIRTEILKPYIGQEGAIVQHQRKTAMAFPVSNQLHSVLIERASK